MLRHGTTRATKLNEEISAKSSPAPRSSLLRAFAVVVASLIVGLPAAFVFTHGMVLLPLGILVILFPFVAIHYVLWGWWLAPREEEDKPTKNGTSIPLNYPRSPASEDIQLKDSRFYFFR